MRIVYNDEKINMIRNKEIKKLNSNTNKGKISFNKEIIAKIQTKRKVTLKICQLERQFLFLMYRKNILRKSKTLKNIESEIERITSLS